MRAINSSTAFSTCTFSLTTRFIAFAQMFSLFRIVNCSLGELEGQSTGHELVRVAGVAVAVGLPEEAFLALLIEREPASERALDVRAAGYPLRAGT